MHEYVIISIVIITFIITFFLMDKCLFGENEISYKSIKSDFFIKNYTDDIELTRTNSINIYLNIPENIVYWSVGIFDKKHCLKSINMSNYLNIELGDTLHIIITKNSNLLDKSIKKIEDEHEKRHSYKRLIRNIINLNKEKIKIRYELYFINNIYNNCFKIYNFKLTNIMFRKLLVENKKECSDVLLKENINLYNKFIPDYFRKDNISVSQNLYDNFSECLSYISEPLIPTDNFKILCVNHFKTKVALHSHVLILNYFNGKILKIFYTGVITNSVFQNNKMELRELSFSYNSKIVVVENIFLYDDVKNLYIDDIIPMKIVN